MLDLKICINNGIINTETYQKPMNLYLYVPLHSAHPPGLLHSLVFGTLRRYWLQNSLLKSFQKVATLFFDRLLARGYPHKLLCEAFTKAAKKIDANNTLRKKIF